MKYIKQLDSLRAIAVLLVLIWHGLPLTSSLNKIDNGRIGVTLFFVLSGFLITKILIETRIGADQEGGSRGPLVRQFFIRRALRIFPIYYLTIVGIYISHLLFKTHFSLRETFYSATYTINFYIYHIKHWTAMTAHFWSLAVEEQFYLFWPFVILFIRRRFLLPVILLFILTGLVAQLLNTDYDFGYTPTYTCFDALGMGGLLAYVKMFHPARMNHFRRVVSILTVPCLLLTFLGRHFPAFHYPTRTATAVPALWLVTFVIENRDNKHLIFTTLFNNRFLLFIGKISYAIYLFHIPVLHISDKVLLPFLRRQVPILPTDIYTRFGLMCGISFLLAWLSWIFVESPLLKLKRYFTYQKTPGPNERNITILPSPATAAIVSQREHIS